MNKILITVAGLIVLLSCKNQLAISNLTTPGGYAIGENVKLAFQVTGEKHLPDSLVVKVYEKSTGYIYSVSAQQDNCDNCGRYKYLWDGRKPDGSWPAGGRYWVYAVIPEAKAVSDTVEIGLAD